MCSWKIYDGTFYCIDFCFRQGEKLGEPFLDDYICTHEQVCKLAAQLVDLSEITLLQFQNVCL